MCILIFGRFDVNILAALTAEGCGHRRETAALYPLSALTPSQGERFSVDLEHRESFVGIKK